MNEKHGNRIFEIKESVITQCQECGKKHTKPSLTYYVNDLNKVVCLECAKGYKDKELRIFVDMNNEVNAKIIKDWNE